MRGKQRLGPYRAVCLADLVRYSSALKASRSVGLRRWLGLLHGAFRHRLDDILHVFRRRPRYRDRGRIDVRADTGVLVLLGDARPGYEVAVC